MNDRLTDEIDFEINVKDGAIYLNLGKTITCIKMIIYQKVHNLLQDV